MSKAKRPTAIEKRKQNREALKPFSLDELKEKLPLVLAPAPGLPPSPKTRYRSAYRYLGADDLNEKTLNVFSPFFHFHPLFFALFAPFASFVPSWFPLFSCLVPFALCLVFINL